MPELSKGEETTTVKGGQVCNWAVVPRRISSAIFVPVSRQTDASHEHKQVKKKLVVRHYKLRHKK